MKWVLGFVFSFLSVVPVAFALSPTEVATRIKEGRTTHVVFDVNGVLLKRMKLRSMRHIGLGRIICELCKRNRFWDQDQLFASLRKVRSEYSGKPIFHEGREMPGVMIDWQLGTISGQEALQRCHQDLPAGEVLPEILDLMFRSKLLADVLARERSAVKLLQTLRARQIPTYVISNMDLETAERLKKKFPDIFDSMNGIIWSAAVHLVKPDRRIFLRALDDFKLDPEKTLFIDDEETNRNGAKEAGIVTMEPQYMEDLVKELEG